MSYRQLQYYYDHSKERNEYYRKRRVERKANHICVMCGKKLPKNYDKVNCRECLDPADVIYVERLKQSTT